MRRLEIKRHMGGGDIAAVSALLDVAGRSDRHRPLGEHQWLDLVQGGREGFVGLVAWEADHNHPVGYAQLNRGPGTWSLELVVDPHHREWLAEIGTELVQAAVAVVRGEGGGHVHLWVPKPTVDHDRIAAAAGLTRGRELLQMRRPLPAEVPVAGFHTRAFEPGRDDDAWLDVNNRAFHHHPEQGGWDRETLRERQKETWFDAAGFRLHEREGRLAGFCWTKVHLDTEPPLGELYVIAVDPDLAGQGLGRALALDGLHWLHRRGLSTAMLYVDSASTSARRLYDGLGFAVDHRDRAYVGDFQGEGGRRGRRSADADTDRGADAVADGGGQA